MSATRSEREHRGFAGLIHSVQTNGTRQGIFARERQQLQKHTVLPSPQECVEHRDEIVLESGDLGGCGLFAPPTTDGKVGRARPWIDGASQRLTGRPLTPCQGSLMSRPIRTRVPGGLAWSRDVNYQPFSTTSRAPVGGTSASTAFFTPSVNWTSTL